MSHHHFNVVVDGSAPAWAARLQTDLNRAFNAIGRAFLNLAATDKAQTYTALQSFDAGVSLGTGARTATAAAGAATLNKLSGKITTEALTTAAGADYALTLTNSTVAATDIVLASVNTGTNTTEGLSVHRVAPAAGSATIRVRNAGAAALNGTIVISFAVMKV